MSGRTRRLGLQLPLHDVFISYAGPDRSRAAAIANALEAKGVHAWWDDCLLPDEPFEQQIQRVLTETRLIVAVLSPHTLDSEWVRWELLQGMHNGLHLVLMLVNGLRSDDLPPPFHLVSRLSLADDTDASLSAAATEVEVLVAALTRNLRHAQGNDARRRLASAAASIARQATDIKQRRSGAMPEPPVVVTAIADHTEHQEAEVRYTVSDGLASFLRDQQIALAFSSFQSGKLFFVGYRVDTDQLTIDVQPFRKPTGLFVRDGHLVVATLGHVYRLENILRPGQRIDSSYTHCFAPRMAHLTGVLDAHDVALTNDGIILVATRYNCLATVSTIHSFRSVWKPLFITDIVGEDRCHLNGLALRDGVPAFVTVLACSNKYDGWRERRTNGGLVIDVLSNEIVCDQLSMPHSPRLHNGHLWFLNSGSGEIGFVDDQHRFQSVAWSPGFARGLTFHGRFAAITLSKPRGDGFNGLTLERLFRQRGEEPWCGVRIVDISTGECIHWLRIEGQVRELYDVIFLPGVACPRAVSPLSDEGLDLITIE